MPQDLLAVLIRRCSLGGMVSNGWIDEKPGQIYF
jgi:hypothetical protein